MKNAFLSTQEAERERQNLGFVQHPVGVGGVMGGLPGAAGRSLSAELWPRPLGRAWQREVGCRLRPGCLLPGHWELGAALLGDPVHRDARP